ncbi:right-handed parallel beta-helix repeat-containing protein [Paenibacillus sp. PCH8]|uniref:right-handed parallel beta-helix repeat-containing protein n=1 Tax=Paenibacillus sp. PCH8 TaxID=2066524 RepID=UPI0021585424|nr:right-handed parallel beta-helix repeat-containing protein [Paenibacillus sp. PCH8]
MVESNNNTFTGNTIFLRNATLKPDATIRLANANNNKLISNEMTTYAGFSGMGIRTTSSSNNVIRNNVTDTAGKSISIEGGSNNVNTGNRNR